ncbi:MAG: DUF1573 domain-containing protein [candidate division Zixibacteria bacterium]|nr:DUF1573 domain-containing protein [candidate division Zixibacteria bacterium]MCI0595735.1 DUF1573 domain-containing protein [candidate division Zixibacteria bacterium]
MKRVFFTVLPLALVFGVAASQEEPQQNIKAGRLEISQKTWDFGFIPRGAKVTHNFLLKNAGNDTLRITNVRKSCGCTAAPLRKTTLPPGDTTQLEVTFSSGSYQGPVSKAVYVESNDPIEPFIDITFLANVSVPFKLLSFDPFFIKFDTIRQLPVRASIKVTNIDSQAVSFSIAEEPLDYVSLKTRRKKLAPGQEAEIEVVLAKAPPTGEFGTSFTVMCDDDQKSRFSIPIQGFYQSPK